MRHKIPSIGMLRVLVLSVYSLFYTPRVACCSVWQHASMYLCSKGSGKLQYAAAFGTDIHTRFAVTPIQSTNFEGELHIYNYSATIPHSVELGSPSNDRHLLRHVMQESLPDTLAQICNNMATNGSICQGFVYDSFLKTAFFKGGPPQTVRDISKLCLYPNTTLWLLTAGVCYCLS